jgi:hypothetical protein
VDVALEWVGPREIVALVPQYLPRGHVAIDVLAESGTHIELGVESAFVLDDSPTTGQPVDVASLSEEWVGLRVPASAAGGRTFAVFPLDDRSVQGLGVFVQPALVGWWW